LPRGSSWNGWLVGQHGDVPDGLAVSEIDQDRPRLLSIAPPGDADGCWLPFTVMMTASFIATSGTGIPAALVDMVRADRPGAARRPGCDRIP
jgi:hypothetical protein